MGHDTKLLSGAISLKSLAENQDRVFITTSKRWEKTLKNMGIEYLVVPRHDWRAQLCAVIKHFELEVELKLNLCAYCGQKLVSVDKESFKSRIPPRAYEEAYDFTFCPQCGALFWKGTHYQRMFRTLERILQIC